MEIHEICEQFPALSDEAIEKLKKSILDHGQLRPIWVYEGKILDGRHLFNVVKELGFEPVFKEYKGDNPFQFALELNRQLRVYSPGQMAALESLSVKWDNKEKKELTEERAKRSGVSKRTQNKADVVAKEKPELLKDVVSGEKTVNEVYEELKPKEKKPSELDMLREENADLRENMAMLLSDLQSKNKLIEELSTFGHDSTDALRKVIIGKDELNKTLELRVKTLMEEKKELSVHAINWKKKYEALAKQVK